jgi:hypothetical protein
MWVAELDMQFIDKLQATPVFRANFIAGAR